MYIFLFSNGLWPHSPFFFFGLQGRIKSIFENMPKSNLEPTPKFDCHVHKNASKVSSLLSYRAFELTQVSYMGYFYYFMITRYLPELLLHVIAGLIVVCVCSFFSLLPCHLQQYFYEFAFEELRSRPRHVCPYAVVSFQYKGKESATVAHRYRFSSVLYCVIPC